ncbi:unnamed protein product [Caenorhabditis auriculariae]|uniref:Uncharacterized protein n=1 Tax=Caenorhabditis auriculariae TaxID=2777116 RepID=A0A8S1HCG0_9PELO|nr:unnamed protein product [Caenorhabditis auriculariae]
MRRRSLVAMNIQPRESPIVPVAKERTEAVRLPVTLEADEPTMTKAEKEPPPLLEAPSEGSSNRTFRIIDKAEEIRPAKSLLPIFGKSEPSSSITTWLRNKMEKERAVKESARKAEAAKKEAEEERRKNAARLFERWKAEHDEEAKRKLQIEKQRLKEKKQRESQEKKSRQDEAQKMFEVWKRERSKSMTEIHRKEVDKEKKKKEEAEKQKQQRREEADAAFRAWVAKKKKGQRAASSDPKKKDEEDKIKDFRQMMAQEAYEAWLEMKMHERDIEATLKPLEGPIVPWIPPNNTVPRRFVGSAQRRRAQKSHMQRSQSAKARPRTNPPLR